MAHVESKRTRQYHRRKPLLGGDKVTVRVIGHLLCVPISLFFYLGMDLATPSILSFMLLHVSVVNIESGKRGNDRLAHPTSACAVEKSLLVNGASPS